VSGKNKLTQMEIIILRLLANNKTGELHAFKMIKLSQGRLLPGSVYTILSKMEEKGYILARKEELEANDFRMPRKFYRLSEAGKEAVTGANEFDDKIRGLNNEV